MAKVKQVTAPAAPEASANGSKKTPCPVSRGEFVGAAKPLTVIINGIPYAASVKLFSTGSFGWYLNGQTVVEVDGVPCKVQIGLNLTVANSKDAAE